MAPRGIVYLAMMSDACRAELHELCRDDSCNCHVCHDDQLEPLDLDAAGDDATILHAEARFEAGRDD